MDYTPDGERDQLFRVLTEFTLFELTVDQYLVGSAPPDWAPSIEKATRSKQRGRYRRAAEILTTQMRDEGAAYTELTDMLFEIEVCSGLITMGLQRLCSLIDRTERAGAVSVAEGYRARLGRLVDAFASEDRLRTHLAGLCGNPSYFLPSDFAELKSQLERMRESDLYARYFHGLEADNGMVPMTVTSDGSLLFSAHRSLPFEPDGKWEEISQLVTRLIHDSNVIRGTLRRSADKYPDAWSSKVTKAVDLKRRGKFLASAKIYDDLTRSSGVLYTGIIAALYKSVAPAGALLSANFLLINGEMIFQSDPKAVAGAAGGPSNFEDHLSRLISASKSRAELETYLRDICGNVDYRLPRDYAAAVSELTEHYADMAKRMEKLNRTERHSSGGCYIATAVYGSYEAAPVLTLRRFRDERLATSRAGRAFIAAYYALSPAVAKRLEKAAVLNGAVRRLLDVIVFQLEK